MATRIGIIHQGRLIEELDADSMEDLRAQRLLVQTRNLSAAQAALTSAGYCVEKERASETLALKDARAIEAPEEVATVLVGAGVPPTRLGVEQENLEEHFLRLTGVLQ